MEIALISDIHGNLPALEAVLTDIARRGIAQIINLGDSLSGPLWPLETGDFLRRQPWLQLAGNHERQLLDFDPAIREAADRYTHALLTEDLRAWMRSLPAHAWVSDEVFICHGTPASDTEYFLETVTLSGLRMVNAEEVRVRMGNISARLIACGHTHLPRIVRTVNGQLIVNPGSVGFPAFDDNHPWPHVVENGSPDARYASVERDNGKWQANLHAVPYDFEAAARLADARHMPDWAYALRTGYMPS